MTEEFTQEQIEKLIQEVDGTLKGLEALQFEEGRSREIMEWTLHNTYGGFEPVLGVIIFDQYDTIEVKRYADEKGIKYRKVELIDMQNLPDHEAARIRKRFRGIN